MVRAVALLALCEAARHGDYRASFHGFHVWAWRQPARRSGDLTINVKFLVIFDKDIAERGTVSMQRRALMPLACDRRNPPRPAMPDHGNQWALTRS